MPDTDEQKPKPIKTDNGEWTPSTTTPQPQREWKTVKEPAVSRASHFS